MSCHRLLISWILSGLLLTTAAHAAWHETGTSAPQTATLTRVEQLVSATKQPVVVFDLDSTLYDNRPRHAKIVQAFGVAKQLTALAQVTTATITDSFQIAEIVAALLKQQGLTDPTAVVDEFKNFWAQRFFSNDFIQYDRPLPGAVAFVKGLYDRGAAIVYISGRDEKNMRTGTEAKLRADGFPVGVPRTALHLKPTANTALNKDRMSKEEYAAALKKTDADFKVAAIDAARAHGTVVASFENEPGNINLYFKQFHQQGTGVAVFVATDHFPNPPPLETGIVTVHGFLK